MVFTGQRSLDHFAWLELASLTEAVIVSDSVIYNFEAPAA